MPYLLFACLLLCCACGRDGDATEPGTEAVARESWGISPAGFAGRIPAEAIRVQERAAAPDAEQEFLTMTAADSVATRLYGLYGLRLLDSPHYAERREAVLDSGSRVDYAPGGCMILGDSDIVHPIHEIDRLRDGWEALQQGDMQRLMERQGAVFIVLALTVAAEGRTVHIPSDAISHGRAVYSSIEHLELTIADEDLLAELQALTTATVNHRVTIRYGHPPVEVVSSMHLTGERSSRLILEPFGATRKIQEHLQSLGIEVEVEPRLR